MLENPLKVFVGTFGLTNYLLNLIIKRFESFDYYYIQPNKITFVFFYIIKFVPSHSSFANLYLYRLLLIDYSNSYQKYRHMFNLPVNGQSTWRGGNSLKRVKSDLFLYKLNKYLKYTNLNTVLYAAEIINMLWRYQWFHEWKISSYYIKHLPWYIRRKRKWVGATDMMGRRIESFFKHPFKNKKKKHHRKKKVINKHVITTGFDIGFSMTEKKNLA